LPAPDYGAIEAAVLSVGGWMDAYVDAALRMQARCTAPTRSIVGNSVHALPADATPGPNVDDLEQIVRFFDHHLRGVDNGVDREPALVRFEREYAPPEPFPTALPGRWRAAAAYPHPAAATRSFPVPPYKSTPPDLPAVGGEGA
jgi:predicted acyl esterase